MPRWNRLRQTLSKLMVRNREIIPRQNRLALCDSVDVMKLNDELLRRRVWVAAMTACKECDSRVGTPGVYSRPFERP